MSVLTENSVAAPLRPNDENADVSLDARRSGFDWHRAQELLSSMRFAISLLSLICVASVIGTIIKQQEPYNNYVNQFGSFWAAVFDRFGLYSVYSAWWFMLILAFLVLSTSLCIARNTPKILNDVKSFKENIRINNLKAFAQKAEWTVWQTLDQTTQQLGATLSKQGWKYKIQHREAQGSEGRAGVMLAAKKGVANKFGYLAAHSAIVLICLGALSDGDLVVKAQAYFGGKQPFAGGGMIADVPKQHWLSASNPTFRGNVLVSEGQKSDVAILSQSDGIFLQPLPFNIELKKFIVEFYSTGMPKLFASDIVIHDKETGKSQEARVEVNHPVEYQGVSIFQSSFEDGGSAVTLKAVPLSQPEKTFEVKGSVGSSTQLSNGAEKKNLEFTGLRVFNIENFGESEVEMDSRTAVLGVRQRVEARLGAGDKSAQKKTLRNVGPSVSYKLRDAAGQAREFNNYMQPVDMGDGSLPVFLLGVRETPAEPYRYVRIPVDAQHTMRGFFQLRQALQNATLRTEAANRFARIGMAHKDAEAVEQLRITTLKTLDMFSGQDGKTVGVQALGDFLEKSVPEAERAKTGEVLLRVLDGALFELFRLQNSQQPDQSSSKGWTEAQQRSFVAQSLLGLSDIALYPEPLVLMLQEFKQVQASVFQVSRSPGKTIVYLGCVLLILGVFAMLYIRERRIWLWLSQEAGATTIQMAMSSNRKTMDSDQEFLRLKEQLS